MRQNDERVDHVRTRSYHRGPVTINFGKGADLLWEAVCILNVSI
jgi:hypothetical protein